MKEEENTKSEVAKREEEILKFWEENKIFEKSLGKKAPRGEFVFYEGPPTANGKPGIHHLVARAFKDAIPRYKTMQGFHVRRKAGWDTHGLPVELQVEKQLGLKSKKEIEEYGVAAFNQKCKESVWEYKEMWEKFTKRIGYWVDEKDAYITYKNEYIESVWNVLKKVSEKGLLYKDYKVVPWCPRCGTALSSHELAQGYETVKDLSVYAKFKIIGFEKAYFLAWTTTPWTLPGNVALAVGKDIVYVEVRVGEEILVLAKDRLSIIEGEYKIIAEHKGSEMVGMQYEPLYDFLSTEFGDKNKEVFEKAYKVYVADFVNTTDGTGIVHTAVMYGQDDFVLGTQVGLPKVHTVLDTGHFINEMGFLAGKFVKDEETTVSIIKDLAHRGLLFKKEKYEHTYPHCWRCKTPLIYYARDSWYIRMSELRDKLVKENEKINWEPAHFKEGRFGEWLREVKDWAISRERYWGTPLPVWQNQKGEISVIGSIADLKKHTKKSGNQYFVMRHGEAENNVLNIINSDLNNVYHLTEGGKEQAIKAGKDLKSKKIDLIFSSPFARCLETAEIIKRELNISSEIMVDDRLRELKFDEEFENKNFDSYRSGSRESYTDVTKRVGEFLYELEGKYKNRNILITTHGAGVIGLENVVGSIEKHEKPKFAEPTNLDFVPLPHNENYELDLHKPYIDEVELVDEDGNELKRTKEVMDVWFDSGAMPFAQDHYPWNEEKWHYPADYIAEAVDQTRGWFYTLHAVGVLLGEGHAYKNVICLGHILDKDGKKMSKSVGNVVDPWLMIEKYGVDAIRLWMYSVNQPGDSKNFDEKTVDELVKKVFNPITNVLAFYELYAIADSQANTKSDQVLDRWILSRLNQLVGEGTQHLNRYKLFEATRLIRDFINDFSTWYVRRSRDRFKSEMQEDKNNALATTKFVLLELAKYLAPFAPFFAEDLYRKLRGDNDPESVHLCEWPKSGKVNEEILTNMEEVRRIVSLALEKRMTANIKVRQPLRELRVKSLELKGKEEYLELIKDEVNVKEILFDQELETEVILNTEITPELQKEGNVRELVRAVQDLRKQKNLLPSESVILKIETDEAGKKFVEESEKEIKKPTNVSDFVFEKNTGVELSIQDLKLTISIR